MSVTKILSSLSSLTTVAELDFGVKIHFKNYCSYIANIDVFISMQNTSMKIEELIEYKMTCVLKKDVLMWTDYISTKIRVFT